MHGQWMVYIHKKSRRDACRWQWTYPRVSLVYHMLEILVDDDAGTCLMMRLVSRRGEGKGRVGRKRELEGREKIT